MPKNKDKDQAEIIIRRLANQGCIAFSKHCRDSMNERSVTADDFLQVLMWGQVLTIEKDSKTEHWKCEVNGTDIDGDNLTVHVAIDEVRQMVVCITVY